jgi:hypothetical protein
MNDPTLVRGSCLCGDVRWQARGPLSLMSHCHCSMCRKAHGAPFATYVAAPAAGFELEAGEAGIAAYRSSPASERRFCSRCGSVVPSEPDSRYAFMPVGCLDDDPGVRPLMHIFAASKAPWYTIADGVAQSAAYPEGWGSAEIVRTPEPPSDPNWVRGSCLCGKVAYEVEHGGHTGYFCHCSRCRKARAAAHASNMFVPPARFRWVRGEDQRLSYKVPDAERFTVVFCGSCGSGAPNVRAERAMLPASTLDGDPGFIALSHIFVGSKAAWDVLPDDGRARHDGFPPT